MSRRYRKERLSPKPTGAIAEIFPNAAYQRCTLHFYRNVMATAPKQKQRKMAAMLKAIHAQKSFDASMRKADDMAAELDGMNLKEAVKCAREDIAETLSCTRFPMEHWNGFTQTTPSSV